MITGRFATPGKTRICPHCRATILDSATVCPGCHHHLRFDPSGASQRAQPAATPLRVEGTLRHAADGGAWEYSIVLAIRNDRGEEISRQVVGVGALLPGDARTFSLAVEVFKPVEMKESKPQGAEAAPRGAADPRGPAEPRRSPTDPKAPDVRAPGRPGLPPGVRPAAAVAPGKPASAPASQPAPAASSATPPAGKGQAPQSPKSTPGPAVAGPSVNGAGTPASRGMGAGWQPKRS